MKIKKSEALLMVVVILFFALFYPGFAQTNKARVNKVKKLLEYAAINIKTISGEAHFIILSYGKKKKSGIRFYAKHPDKIRIEYLYPEHMKGTLIITDGKTLWRYISSLNKTFVDEKSNNLAQELGFISSLVPKNMEDLWKQYDLIYLGENKVGKEKTYVVELIPKKSEEKNVKSKQKLWVDKKIGIPLKMEIQFLEVQQTITLKNLKINQKISDELFVYQEK